MKNNMWNKLTIEVDTIHYWHIGLKEIYLRKKDGTWLISLNESSEQATTIVYDAQKKDDSNLEWQTIIGDINNMLQLLPAFPNRPVVIKPKTSLRIMPLKDTLLFLQIPMWIQFYAGKEKKENLLFECCSVELSSTWFGEPDNGTLAYSQVVDPSTVFNKPVNTPNYITCPIRLTNDSNAILDLQRLLLQVEYLNIYRLENELYSNEIKIKFRGEGKTSDVQYDNNAPAFLNHPMKISASRSTKQNNVISKSFHIIKSLTNN